MSSTDQCSGEDIVSEAPMLKLPDAPATETGPVKAWREPVIMQTYLPAAPDPNPLFLEKRVYQGSSGRVYPLAVIDRIETTPREHAWDAVHLENELIRVMILPEIGGRIHVGQDKVNGYDFFYRQNVIKPALVGLAGPWISGGVEFNWPQHHRPATFMPTDVAIEREPDGTVIVWSSDYDPMSRLKGMHGVCLRPGKAYLELRVRLYNGTTDTHTFLWWANAATRVHEKYQSFFPKDARFVADHAKRAVTEFPLSHGTYYGVNYSDRGQRGVPEEEQPRCFRPDGSYPANDLSWYANIPVPTSYMITGSRGDYFGGYDHGQHAGVVHYADHHIAPGKKQWTWGNHEFGYAWDRSLTDSDGPYIELMAGVYTDNQPDFSFLAPGETKTFRQWWYPIRETGVPDEANLEAAMRMETHEDGATVHLLVTSERSHCVVRVLVDGQERGRWQGDLTPRKPLHHTFAFELVGGEPEVLLEQDGHVLLRYAPAEIVLAERPAVATEPLSPAGIRTNDELFLTGLHLEQYRHPTRFPEIYWQEAIRRDPGDCRSQNALGRWHLRRGEFAQAEKHFSAAIARLTARNPNPPDGEPHYNLGRTLLYLGRREEAYAAFYKSTWNAAWRGPGYHRLAEIDCSRGEWEKALGHLQQSLKAEAENLNARNLQVIVLRRLGRMEEAEAVLRATRALDSLDIFSNFLETGLPPQKGQQRINLSFDLLRAGLIEKAQLVASAAGLRGNDGSAPMLQYLETEIQHRSGERPGQTAASPAAAIHCDYVFPSRLEELVLLEKSIRRDPKDPRAPYYLGNLLYDRRRHREAISLWQRSAQLDPDFPTVWRNLGFAYFNVLHEPLKARDAFARARRLAPRDARILFEQDQLAKRTGVAPHDRLTALAAEMELVRQRDDLSVELATLYNSEGEPERALSILENRCFQPWEGGEGLVLGQYVRAKVMLAERAIAENRSAEAVHFLEAAVHPPYNLGEAHHLLVNLSRVEYWLGAALAASGDSNGATLHWEKSSRARADFRKMQVQAISEMTWWSALALRRLGKEEESVALLQQIQQYAYFLENQEPAIDYFATSLPAMLLFDDDLKQRQIIAARFLRAQALLGLGRTPEALESLREVLRLDPNHYGAIDLIRASGATR